MSDLSAARETMVEGQVRTNDVTDRRLIAAMRAIPREAFAPKSKRAVVYGDLDVPVADGRWLLRPRDFSKLVQALDIRPNEVVLDIACGRGYSSAVLACLAETVVALESEADLAKSAQTTLSNLGIDTVAVVTGALAGAAAAEGPYAAVFVNAAVEVVPPAWLDVLSEGGRLGVIVRKGPIGQARLFTKSGGVIGDRALFDSGAPLLPGFEAVPTFTFS